MNIYSYVIHDLLFRIRPCHRAAGRLVSFARRSDAAAHCAGLPDDADRRQRHRHLAAIEQLPGQPPFALAARGAHRQVRAPGQTSLLLRRRCPHQRRPERHARTYRRTIDRNRSMSDQHKHDSSGHDHDAAPATADGHDHGHSHDHDHDHPHDHDAPAVTPQHSHDHAHAHGDHAHTAGEPHAHDEHEHSHDHDHHDHDHGDHQSHDHAHDDHDHGHSGGHAHAAAPAHAHKHDHRHAHAGHDHDHGHDHHDHDHDHGFSFGHHHHHHAPTTHGRAFAIAIALNAMFVVIEFVYGFLANSTALMADAGHNLSDVLGLMLAWGAAILAKRMPKGRYTYGLRSTSMMAALFNSMVLMATCGVIAWEAVQQLLHPNPVAGATVSVVAAIGIAVNGFSAWLFVAGSKGDINIRGAYLHMAADAVISFGVLVAGLIVMFTGWSWLDPLVSVAIVVMIVLGTWSLLRESLNMMLAAVPDSVDAAKVAGFLRARPGVQEVHDLHIWSMSTTETALTAHLVMPSGYPGDVTMDAISAELKQTFAIHHSTLQIEMGTTPHACCLQPDHA